MFWDSWTSTNTNSGTVSCVLLDDSDWPKHFRSQGEEKDCVLPVREHQVVSQQSAATLWPEDLHQAARVQGRVHVEGVGQLVHRLRREKSQLLHLHTHTQQGHNVCLFLLR